MKKLVTLVLLFCSLQSFGQMTLVKETDKSFYPFQLSNGKWMLYSNVYKNNKVQSITLYNEDFSVYKSINFSQKFPYDTTGYTYNHIGIVEIQRLDGVYNEDLEITDMFFNTDSKMELIFCYQSSKNENGKTIGVRTDIIINEDGEEVLQLKNLKGDDIGYEFWKYLTVRFENQENYNLSTRKTYSVPGNLPCPSSCSQKAASIAPITQTNEFKEIQVTGFPNPSSEKVTLAYSLPEGTPFGTLRLYTQTGELVKEFKVSNQVDHLELPVSEYNSGTYFYELQAGGSSSGGKKMVVIH